MKRHGLALLIAHYRNRKYNFLYRRELYGERDFGYYFQQASPRPFEVTREVCYRYLRMKGLLTVGNWNKIIEIAAHRVCTGVGAHSVIRSLEINNRSKKRIMLSSYGHVIPVGKFRSMQSIYARRQNIKLAIAERQAKEKEQEYQNKVKASISLHKAKSELSELRSLTKSLERAIKDGKEYNENHSRITCEST